MNKILELRQSRAQKVEDLEKLVNAAEAEERDLTEDEQSVHDELMKQISELGNRIERLEKMGEVVGERSTQTRKAPAHNKTRLGDSEERAIAHYVRTGDMGGLQEWRAANDTIGNVAAGADGLYAVPTGHYGQIIAKRDESMLANQIGVMRIPGQGLTVNVPVDNEADVEFASTSEQVDNYSNTYTRDFPALNQVAMTLVKYTKKIALSEELLEDEDSNLLSFLANYVGRAMASQHNSLLLTELRASGTAALTLDSASTVGAAEIPELVYTLPGEYADGSVWVMARATEGLIRGLQGSDFLFNPNPAGSDRGRPEIWGFPVYNSTSASAIAASAKSLIFGNMGYVGLREGTEMQFLRDPYTTDGIVYLKYRFRAVYKVLQAEAIRYATHPTA